MQLDSQALPPLVPRPAEVWGVISRGFPVWTLPKAATQGPVAVPRYRGQTWHLLAHA